MDILDMLLGWIGLVRASRVRSLMQALSMVRTQRSELRRRLDQARRVLA